MEALPWDFGGSTISAAGNIVSGSEGNGTIRFSGTFLQIAWRNPVFESYYGFTVGAAGATASVPQPVTFVTLLTDLLTMPVLIRRRARLN